MPKGPPPAWRARAGHTVEMLPVVAAALAQLGHEVEATYSGIASRERALDLRRGIFNSARGLGVSVNADAEPDPKNRGQWRIRFTLHDKRTGRAHVLATHGTDRTAWPYDTRAKARG
jgi:hypothetical protein